MPTDTVDLVQGFHDLFYDHCQFIGWLGVAVQKTPTDLWVYQEIIVETKPDLLIETGTQTGGSAYYFASIMDLVGNGEVVTIDVAGPDVWIERPEHPRLTYCTASSTDPGTILRLIKESRLGASTRVMVSLDSDHSYKHVLKECELYGPLVTPGCYMVVEDTNITGAKQAAAEYAERGEFEVDRDREKYLLTFHPGGWLRKL